MDTRYSQRAQLQGMASFRGEQVVGQGQLVNLSVPGCLIRSATPVKEGDYLQLRVNLPHEQVALEISLAAVRWVEGDHFAAEFIRMSGEDQELLKKLVDLSGCQTLAIH